VGRPAKSLPVWPAINRDALNSATFTAPAFNFASSMKGLKPRAARAAFTSRRAFSPAHEYTVMEANPKTASITHRPITHGSVKVRTIFRKRLFKAPSALWFGISVSDDRSVRIESGGGVKILDVLRGGHVPVSVLAEIGIPLGRIFAG
jgi:hypothetical protein